MILNIPTILTLLRIASIPVIMVIFYLPIDEPRLWCTLIFVVASLTDWFDGFLARKLNLQTAFGEFLDPVADKLMVVILLVLIVQADPAVYIAIPAAIIIGREVSVAALREWMAELGQRSTLQVSLMAKFKTGFQMLAIVCLLYNTNLYDVPVRAIGICAIYIAAILTLWSMWQYIQLALPQFKK
ncbi:MAG: CDP-diacylglycerol--glycerol-3-phosphate 3-phosphatidyltransferase [Piscirickettsiaceae bacterium]|nr:MAG: CDP-diacylglycerol--glycerol-3-phosphate 3-phosphatidyltransferase [Piscirickettsiaceae bacterium]PCI70954.1 MAG: CDP-diacylglycerol--glycerol-3-phosphate 3-phosphatidyltransferase [Piscirickettsiaceae bacterium]